MFIISGKYSEAIFYSNSFDEGAINQVTELCSQDFTLGAQIRIMPDYHLGTGCTIGFTANLGNKIIPNLVGVDIGCGMYVLELGKVDLDLSLVDEIIHRRIPSGFHSHRDAVAEYAEVKDLSCYDELPKDMIQRQIGTLGGGNHFIEIDKDNDGCCYLVIHSGSRNLGKRVADYHQSLAIEKLKQIGNKKEEKDKIIQSLKSEGREKEIQVELKKLERKFSETEPIYPKHLCFLEGEDKDNYLHDMNIIQEYASLNRFMMGNILLSNLGLSPQSSFETIHNYINFKDNIIRKGAVSAYDGEKLIIPINMKDGSLICYGKGNPEWNFSAPHGAGRLMSRGEARKTLKVEDFINSMKDIYSTTVGLSTIDEAPMAYKSMSEIIENIYDTVTIDKIITPVYNFKSKEQ